LGILSGFQSRILHFGRTFSDRLNLGVSAACYDASENKYDDDDDDVGELNVSCCVYSLSEWRLVTIDGVSLPEALRCWERGGRNEKNHYQPHHHQRHHHHQHHHQQQQQQITKKHDALSRLLTGYIRS